MDFVKYYIFPSDYKNLILVNKEFYSIFKYTEPVALLHHLLWRDGWFSIYTHAVIPTMNFKEVIECFIETLETAKRPRWKLNYTIHRTTFNKIKRNKTLNPLNLF
jgi:hypothetical protein